MDGVAGAHDGISLSARIPMVDHLVLKKGHGNAGYAAGKRSMNGVFGLWIGIAWRIPSHCKSDSNTP